MKAKVAKLVPQDRAEELYDALVNLLAERVALQEGVCDDETDEMATARDVIRRYQSDFLGVANTGRMVRDGKEVA